MKYKARMNRQEVFNTAVAGVLAQGERSMFNGKCAYRGSGKGVCCAVGHLMTDESIEIYGSMHNMSISARKPREAVEMSLKCHLSQGDIRSLRRLQNAHDSLSIGLYSEDFLLSANRIADEYNLIPYQVPTQGE